MYSECCNGWMGSAASLSGWMADLSSRSSAGWRLLNLYHPSIFLTHDRTAWIDDNECWSRGGRVTKLEEKMGKNPCMTYISQSVLHVTLLYCSLLSALLHTGYSLWKHSLLLFFSRKGVGYCLSGWGDKKYFYAKSILFNIQCVICRRLYVSIDKDMRQRGSE